MALLIVLFIWVSYHKCYAAVACSCDIDDSSKFVTREVTRYTIHTRSLIDDAWLLRSYGLWRSSGNRMRWINLSLMATLCSQILWLPESDIAFTLSSSTCKIDHNLLT